MKSHNFGSGVEDEIALFSSVSDPDPDSDVFWIRNTDLGSKKKIKMLNRY